MQIPFNKPYMTGKELWYIAQAHANGHLAGDGSFTKKCNAWLEARTGAHKGLITYEQVTLANGYEYIPPLQALQR